MSCVERRGWSRCVTHSNDLRHPRCAGLGHNGEIGYGGPIVFESFSSKVVSPALSNTLGIWRERWTDGMDLARHARAFMRERLTDGMSG